MPTFSFSSDGQKSSVDMTLTSYLLVAMRTMMDKNDLANEVASSGFTSQSIPAHSAKSMSM